MKEASAGPFWKHAPEPRWDHLRPHMRPIDKQMARAILCEVEKEFKTERAVILSKDIKGNEPRYAAMELFPWSLKTTSAYFNVTENTVSWARTQSGNWYDVYAKYRAKIDAIRARLKLPKFPRHEPKMSAKSKGFLDFTDYQKASGV